MLFAGGVPPVEVVIRRSRPADALCVSGSQRDLTGSFAASLFIGLLARDSFLESVMADDPCVRSLRYLFGRVSFASAAGVTYEALRVSMLCDVGLQELDEDAEPETQWELPSRVLMLPALSSGMSIDEMVRAVSIRKRVLGLVASSDKFQGLSLWGVRTSGSAVVALGMGGGNGAGVGGGAGAAHHPFALLSDSVVTALRESDDAAVRSMLLRYHPVVNAAVDQVTEILRRMQASDAGGAGRRANGRRGRQREDADFEESFGEGASCAGGGQPNKRRKNAAAQEAERIYRVLMESRFHLRERVACEDDVALASRKLLEIGFSNYVVQAIHSAYWWVANPASGAAAQQKRAVKTTGERVNMRPTTKDLQRMRTEGASAAVFGCAVGERVCHKEKEFITQEEFYPKSWVVVDMDGEFAMVDMPVADVSHETKSTSLQNIRVYLMTHLNCVVTRRRSGQCVFCMAGFCVDLDEDDPDLLAIRELERAVMFPDVRQIGTWLVNRMTPVAVQPHLVCFKDGVFDVVSSEFMRFEEAVRAQGVVGQAQQVVLECFGGICATDYTAFEFVGGAAFGVLKYLKSVADQPTVSICGPGSVVVPAELLADVQRVAGVALNKTLPEHAPWWCRLIPVFCHLVDPGACVRHSNTNNVAAWLGLLGVIMVPRRYEYKSDICDMYNVLLFLIGNAGAGKTVFSRFLKMMLTEAGAGERNTAGLFSDSGARFALSLFNTDRYRKLTICNEISTGNGGLLNRDAICKFADQEMQETEFKGSSIAGQVVIRSTLLLMGNHFPHANFGLLDTAPMRRILCFDWDTPRELDSGAERAFHAEMPVILVLASYFYNKMRMSSRDNIFTALTGITSDDNFRDFLTLGLGAGLCRQPCAAEDVSSRHVRLGRFFCWVGQNIVPLGASAGGGENEAPTDVDTLLKAWARYELVYYSHGRGLAKFMRRVGTLREYRDSALCPHGNFASSHLEQLLISRFGEKPEDVRAGVTRKVRFVGAPNMTKHAAISLRRINRGRNARSGVDAAPPWGGGGNSAFDVMMAAAAERGDDAASAGGRRGGHKEERDPLFVSGGFAVPLPETIGDCLQHARVWDQVRVGDEDESVDGWTDAPDTKAVTLPSGGVAVCVGSFDGVWGVRDLSSDVLWRVE